MAGARPVWPPVLPQAEEDDKMLLKEQLLFVTGEKTSGSVGQQEMVVICVLGRTDPPRPSHIRRPPAPKLCSFSARFFYLESFPPRHCHRRTCAFTHTHTKLSPLWFSSDWGGMQPLQVTQGAPWKGKGASLHGRRSPAPAPPHGLALSLTHSLPTVGSPQAMVEPSGEDNWRAPMGRHVPEESPSVSVPSQPHHVLALDLSQAHVWVPADL